MATVTSQPATDPAAARASTIVVPRVDTAGPKLIPDPRQRPIPHRRSRIVDFVMAATLLVPIVLVMLGERHTPFVNDEPNLVATSLEANSQWRLAASGLQGSFGLPYGPTPLHIYQLLLMVSGPDLGVLVPLRGIAFIATVAAGLFWFASELKLSRWMVPVLLISPMVVIESFHLWDNTFAIPASILAMASYARFVRTNSTASLVGSVLGCLALLGIHPASIPLVMAIAAHALWNHRQALWSRRVAIGVTALVFGLTMRGYSLHLVEVVAAKLARGSVAAATAPPATAAPGPRQLTLGSDQTKPLFAPLSRPAAALFALGGARTLGGFQMEIAFEDLRGRLGELARTARQGSAWILLGLSATGAGLAAWEVLARQGNASGSDAVAARSAVARIVLLALALTVVFFAAMKVAQGVHYFNGVWIVFAALVWLAVDKLRPRLLMGALVVILVGCSLVVDAACLRHLEQNGGTRGIFGPDLAQQRRALREAVAGGSIIYTNVPNFVTFPDGLRTLAQIERTINLRPLPATTDSHGSLVPVIEYANPLDPFDARLAVRMAVRDSLEDSDFHRIDLFHLTGRRY